MRIIAYAWGADIHCIACTRRAAAHAMARGHRSHGEYDYYHVPEGFGAHPIFDIDETCAQLPVQDGGYDLACSTCLTVITRHYDNNEE